MKERGRTYFGIKRMFDIIGATFGIVITSPIWLITALGICLSDPGPVFYQAHRVGENNKVFVMYKFRSMRQGAANESVFRGEEDRIFPFGHLIRKLKIDELPQMINIFAGSMSFVGPRPAAVDQMSITRGGPYWKLSEVKAGLTGPSALYDYIYGDEIEDPTEYERKVLPTRLKLDLVYLEKMSLGYDFKIIWWTIVCVVCHMLGKTPKRMLQQLIRESEAKEEAQVYE